MVASAFTVFKEAKKALGSGGIDLSSGVFKLALVVSGATMPSVNSSAITWASLITDGVTELAEAGNYSSSGENLVAVSWTLSATTVKLDAQDWSLSANGVDHLSIKVAVIRESAGDNLVCYATLTDTGVIDVSAGNKLIIQFNASGIFTLA